jgi:hypothetical protein
MQAGATIGGMPMGSSHSATEGVANGTYTSFENFQTSRDRDFYVCGRSGDVRRGAHIRPPACRGNAYAQQTGKACGSCHVSKSGGGALTAAGKAFQKKRK